MTAGSHYAVHAAQVFAGVVGSNPKGVALRWTDDRVTTYAELDRLSNQIATLLLNGGIQKRDTVGIAMEKGVTAYAAILACLKIGAAYFCLDPASPAARARAIVNQCAPAYAFVGHQSVDVFECPKQRLDEGAAHVKWLEGIPSSAIALRWTIDGSDPAYVMFTSGSTGTPKGATISQNNLVNFIRWAQTQYSVGPGELVTNLNPLFFDNSVFDIYSSLFSGATLVPFTSAQLAEPAETLATIDRLGCTLFFSVPSLLIYFQRLKLIGPDSFRTMKRIVFGGEGYPKPMLQKLHDAVGHRVELHNVYGPTECTCICSSYRISETDFADLKGYPPLGQLIPNFSYAILGDNGEPVPAGAIGELYLGGPCVGLGYYAAPEQTSAAFVQNPTHRRFIDRMYRTGDLVRLEPADGKLHFVARADTQIKLQGYRIELGEIEHAMQTVAGVDEAVAVFTTDETSARITGIVSASQDVTAGAVRQALPALLPRYMIPDRVVVMRELPKNANGKVDRKTLAAAVSRGEI